MRPRQSDAFSGLDLIYLTASSEAVTNYFPITISRYTSKAAQRIVYDPQRHVSVVVLVSLVCRQYALFLHTPGD